MNKLNINIQRLEGEFMNLVAVNSRNNKNRLVCFIICVLLIFTIFVNSAIEAYAVPLLAIPIVITAVAALTTLLIASGVTSESGGVSGIKDAASEIYNEMDEAMKGIFDRAAQRAQFVDNLTGLALASMPEVDYTAFKSWFTNRYVSGTTQVTVSTFTPAHPFQAPLIASGVSIPESIQELLDNATGGVIYINTDGQVAFFLGSGFSFSRQLVGDGVSNILQGSTVIGWYSTSEPYIHMTTPWRMVCGKNFEGQFNAGLTQSVSGLVPGFPTDWHDTKITTSSQTYTTVSDSRYSPMTNPIAADLAGDVKWKFPTQEFDGPDTTVGVPATSAEDPLALDDIIVGYGSMEAYFEAGNVIVLGDGTVLQKGDGLSIDSVRDLSRAQSLPAEAVPAADAPPWTSSIPDIPIIGTVVKGIWDLLSRLLDFLKSILNAIKNLISTIIEYLANILSALLPKFPPGIVAFFSALLALLIAIIGLFGKIIIFIGQLYTIPASSAMIHPTMIQGLEWARGFDSQTGVNLYGLVTGVISIVLGVVVFKLIRKMIAGIGTAD